MTMLVTIASLASILALVGPVATQHPGGAFTPAATPAGLEPAASVAAACKSNPGSLWDAHVCKALADDVQRGCMPQRRFAHGDANATDVKGAVLLFHGFTACPDAMEALGAELQSAGYHVYIPLNVGHGLRPDACAAGAPDALCVSSGGKTDRIDQFPRTKQPYIDFAQWAVDMMREEVASQAPTGRRADGFIVATGGLSLGAPLATVATSLGNGLFSKTILVNPFFSAAIEDVDFGVADCHRASDPHACMNAFIDTMDGLGDSASVPAGTDVGEGALFSYFVSKFKSVAAWAIDMVMSNVLLNHYSNFLKAATDMLVEMEEHATVNNLSLLDMNYGWGAGCTANTVRPGYCTFHMRHMLALNAFGMYAVSRTAHTPSSSFALLTTYRDGYGRNGITYATASSLAAGNNPVTMCMYPASPSCSSSGILAARNDCGVPHSALSRAENLNKAPYAMPWERDLFDNFVGFVNGTKDQVGSARGAGGMYECGAIEINKLASYRTDIFIDGSTIVTDAIARWA
ncbi:hypothetical protein HK101_002136 [Irineochytrium annulatum]|nr:hypothetical protein HK101_002136 [Irineochytrium annulatum]